MAKPKMAARSKAAAETKENGASNDQTTAIEEGKIAGDLGSTKDYQVFMAVAEKVGFDRRGSTLYKRSPAPLRVCRKAPCVSSRSRSLHTSTMCLDCLS